MCIAAERELSYFFEEGVLLRGKSEFGLRAVFSLSRIGYMGMQGKELSDTVLIRTNRMARYCDSKPKFVFLLPIVSRIDFNLDYLGILVSNDAKYYQHDSG